MKRLFTILAGICTTACPAQQNLKLRYNQPAGAVWENALPLGNGQAGAMVYGNVTTEDIQFNEHTLWSGGPNRNDNLLARDSLGTIRKLIFAWHRIHLPYNFSIPYFQVARCYTGYG
jgi:hypothetical protein